MVDLIWGLRTKRWLLYLWRLSNYQSSYKRQVLDYSCEASDGSNGKSSILGQGNWQSAAGQLQVLLKWYCQELLQLEDPCSHILSYYQVHLRRFSIVGYCPHWWKRWLSEREKSSQYCSSLHGMPSLRRSSWLSSQIHFDIKLRLFSFGRELHFNFSFSKFYCWLAPKILIF